MRSGQKARCRFSPFLNEVFVKLRRRARENRAAQNQQVIVVQVRQQILGQREHRQQLGVHVFVQRRADGHNDGIGIGGFVQAGHQMQVFTDDALQDGFGVIFQEGHLPGGDGGFFAFVDVVEAHL